MVVSFILQMVGQIGHPRLKVIMLVNFIMLIYIQLRTNMFRGTQDNGTWLVSTSDGFDKG